MQLNAAVCALDAVAGQLLEHRLLGDDRQKTLYARSEFTGSRCACVGSVLESGRSALGARRWPVDAAAVS